MIDYLDIGFILLILLILIYFAAIDGNKLRDYLFNEKVKRYEEVMK